MKNHHTPGPWHAAPPDPINQRNKWEVIAASPHCPGMAQIICQLNGPWKPENYRDNARLIAAAPDLLAALRRLMDCPAMNMDDLEAEDKAAHEQAVNAVYKATKG